MGHDDRTRVEDRKQIQGCLYIAIYDWC